MKKVKVLQLQLAYKVKAQAAADLAEQIVIALPPDRYEVVSAYLSGKPEAGQPISQASRSVYFELSDGQTKGLRLKALWQLYKLCREERFDVVVTHRFKPMNMMLLLNSWLKIPLCIGVQHRIGDFERAYRRLQTRYFLGKNWRVVGVSQAVRDYLLSCGAGFSVSNTVQIDNAIDIAHAERCQLPRAQAREALALPADAFVFGTIGRLVPVKAHLHLIQAFARIHKRYPQAVVVIIGEGRTRAELEAAVVEYGLEGRVFLPGAKEDALQYVRAYDVFVMPSLSEGLPLALLEAMSGHLPIIGSNIDSMRSIIEGCGGHLFDVGDIDHLASRLTEMLELSPQALLVEGERAYDYLCKTHSVEVFRRQYRELISSGTCEQ